MAKANWAWVERVLVPDDPKDHTGKHGVPLADAVSPAGTRFTLLWGERGTSMRRESGMMDASC
jgi:hypothetical protein